MASGEHPVHHLLLHTAEVIEAEDAFEEVVRVGHCHSCWRPKRRDCVRALALLRSLRNLFRELSFHLPLPKLGIEAA